MDPNSNSLNGNHSLNASIWGEEVKQEMFAFLEELPEELVSITSFLSAPALALMTLITKIATVVDILIKGIENIFHGAFIEIDDRDFFIQIGLKQLFISLPLAIVDLLFGAPLHMLYNLTADFLGLLTSPFSDYVFSRKTYHEDKIDELKGARSHTEHFQFLMNKASDRHIDSNKLKKLICKWNDTSNDEELECVKNKLENQFSSPNFMDDFFILPVYCNLMFYGDRHVSYDDSNEIENLVFSNNPQKKLSKTLSGVRRPTHPITHKSNPF